MEHFITDHHCPYTQNVLTAKCIVFFPTKCRDCGPRMWCCDGQTGELRVAVSASCRACSRPANILGTRLRRAQEHSHGVCVTQQQASVLLSFWWSTNHLQTWCLSTGSGALCRALAGGWWVSSERELPLPTHGQGQPSDGRHVGSQQGILAGVGGSFLSSALLCCWQGNVLSKHSLQKRHKKTRCKLEEK